MALVVLHQLDNVQFCTYDRITIFYKFNSLLFVKTPQAIDSYDEHPKQPKCTDSSENCQHENTHLSRHSDSFLKAGGDEENEILNLLRAVREVARLKLVGVATRRMEFPRNPNSNPFTRTLEVGVGANFILRGSIPPRCD